MCDGVCVCVRVPALLVHNQYLKDVYVCIYIIFNTFICIHILSVYALIITCNI